MTLVKADIVNEVCSQLGLERRQSKKIVEGILAELKKALELNSDVVISGFGKFHTKNKSARVGRNPMTLESYEIPERTVVVFKPSKIFRGELNK